MNLDHYATFNYLSDALNHWWRLGGAVIPGASGLFDALESVTNTIIQGIIDTGLIVINAWTVAWSAVGLVYDLDLLALGEFGDQSPSCWLQTKNSELKAIRANIYYSSIWMYTAVKSTNLIISICYPFVALYNIII